MSNVFGESLRELRVSKGISQEKLAALSDYKRTNLSMIEAGTKAPSKDLIKRMAIILDTPYECLFAWKLIDKLTNTERKYLFIELQKRLLSQTPEEYR